MVVDHLGVLSPRTLCMCTSEKVSRVADAVLQLGLASLLAGVAGGAIVAKAGDAGINHLSTGDWLEVVNVSGTRDTRWLSGRQLFGIEGQNHI